MNPDPLQSTTCRPTLPINYYYLLSPACTAAETRSSIGNILPVINVPQIINWVIERTSSAYIRYHHKVTLWKPKWFIKVGVIFLHLFIRPAWQSQCQKIDIFNNQIIIAKATEIHYECVSRLLFYQVSVNTKKAPKKNYNICQRCHGSHSNQDMALQSDNSVPIGCS